MKFNGAIEVNGITTIILNKTVKFERICTDYWRYTTKRKRDNVIIPSSIIKSKIQQFINNPYYKVWVHGETINVTKRENDYDTFMGIKNFKTPIYLGVIR